MSLFSIECPSCHTVELVPTTLSGQKTACRNCGQIFVLEEVEAAELKKEIPKFFYVCTCCKAEYRLPEKFLGKKVRCRECGVEDFAQEVIQDNTDEKWPFPPESDEDLFE